MKTKRAWFVGFDGQIKRLPEIEGKELNFKDLYPIIGCDLIEHVGIHKGVDMWVDEEGLLKDNFVVNQKATALYQVAYNSKELGIVGNVIITDNTKEGFIKL